MGAATTPEPGHSAPAPAAPPHQPAVLRYPWLALAFVLACAVVAFVVGYGLGL